ncbi:hypothetical protein Cni_G20338 [Canna indica]|uniref:Ribose-5-phosphate isomerase n=1 Tax=Canna indica TaxID=4628 RepID=A0AAQ3KN07_9LILI|nr:hypothetical protein Cni_G20338 [Canna indica]
MAIPLPHCLHSDHPHPVVAAMPPAAALSQDELKCVAAHRTVELVESDMVLGMGTGSIIAHALALISELLRCCILHDVISIPTSVQAAGRDATAGIPHVGAGVGPFSARRWWREPAAASLSLSMSPRSSLALGQWPRYPHGGHPLRLGPHSPPPSKPLRWYAGRS